MGKALFGRYFKTLKKAFEAYDRMSEVMKEHQSVVQVGDVFMIVGNSQLKHFKVITN
jgi:hypothetical protein